MAVIDLIGRNQNYLSFLKTETDKMKYNLYYASWQLIDSQKQYQLTQPIYALSIDDFIKNGVHAFECGVFPPDKFNDHYIVGIADALKDSKKAKKITLHFGRTSDSAMRYFLKSVQETTAPLELIEIDTVRGVTDDTWKLLPEIIKSKKITINVKNVIISDKVKQEIDAANNDSKNNTNLGPKIPQQDLSRR